MKARERLVTMTLFTLGAAVAGILIVSGSVVVSCGGDDSGSRDGSAAGSGGSAVADAAQGGSAGARLDAAAGGKAGAPAVDASIADATPPAALVITIQNFRYSPENLVVPAGGTVMVVNKDEMPHSVTSQATAGAFTRGAVAGVSFDTGAFSNGTRSFTIPASAPSGTVIPYFCTVHLAGMANAGRITIQ